jgi:hypothetical protein
MPLVVPFAEINGTDPEYTRVVVTVGDVESIPLLSVNPLIKSPYAEKYTTVFVPLFQ